MMNALDLDCRAHKKTIDPSKPAHTTVAAPFLCANDFQKLIWVGGSDRENIHMEGIRKPHKHFLQSTKRWLFQG